ncbi:hypothetical protein A2334_01210 [Candidatus Roizmanbacteria bacterium RIFOXYB2_FULL_38_10]|uniref:Uncharacterized protein n=1 Tax=Candidatus Roizmanbacteria bacterium RIFOXYD1_FULL_38_12 TaxID=1802093 RepID=A0A1F7L1K7_9BACT|nr:MAG: hypothetical protein A3K47_04505 [Candidatus Roizmanbacteria bacterium RIFOXYA2_FULL_38_14]OGK64012.1 MAG: hypothetical protein A3K27_04505 [Candidatus Roizmanbacteria bacterium RIFOXYA1_FULL_37_12]OGK65858.1 MAG: hypothetical protein A3K38_04505 [Candidatus Roizmanbacteria bacterium RIFOXYB1_FULL_40_23]OGK68965.1 MAG: hypothetical protein A2334_01210 [Candidatus Roizmanbacteria bacterium RIFOXYB2_FULL_38_10]OGK70263.1 MAG: hypothetical protein A3K21_04510 [Candidatus Roizmanbacteria ba
MNLKKKLIWYAAFFVGFTLISIFFLPSFRLFGDETFYWVQATAIRERGAFILFESTNPFLYPLLLSLFDKPHVARLMNIIFIICTGFVLNILIERYGKDKITLKDKHIYILLFLLFPLNLIYAISLYSEALFIFLFSLMLIYLHDFLYKPSWKMSVFTGILIGLMVLTRLVGFQLLFLIFIFLIITKRMKLLHIAAFIIPVLCVIPYHLVAGHVFLDNRLIDIILLEDFVLMLFHGCFQLFYFWGPWFAFFCIGVYDILKRKDGGMVYVYLLFAWIGMNTFLTFTYFRHWYILTPLVFLITARGIQISLPYLKNHKIWAVIIVFLLYFPYFLLTEGKYIFPQYSNKNHYFLKTPLFCEEIKKLDVTASNKSFTVTLPYFMQKQSSIYEYRTIMNPKQKMNYMVINYADDDIDVFIGTKRKFSRKDASFVPQIVPILVETYEPIPITIRIKNRTLMGGIGQILLCTENPY